MPADKSKSVNLRQLSQASRCLDDPQRLEACVSSYSAAYLVQTSQGVCEFGHTHGKQGASVYAAGLGAIVDAFSRLGGQLSPAAHQHFVDLLLCGPPAATVATIVSSVTLMQPQTSTTPSAAVCALDQAPAVPLLLEVLACRVQGNALATSVELAAQNDIGSVRDRQAMFFAGKNQRILLIFGRQKKNASNI